MHGNKCREEQKRFSISQYNLLLLFCKPNVKFLSYMVVDISLMENVERKKTGHIQEGINRRKPVLDLAMQQVIANYTKY